MDWFVRSIDWISEHTGRLAAWLVVPLILTIVYSVIVRYWLGGVVHWAFEMSIFFYGVLVMLGGAFTLKHQAHVRVDVLAQYLGPRWRFGLDLASFVMVIAVCGLVVWIGTRSAWMSTLRLERSPLQTPFDPQIWWFKWFIPLAAGLIALQALAEIVKAWRTLVKTTQE
jgi:TRAP-type mannitol/chloroaromatic compound transport system permease small subunit